MNLQPRCEAVNCILYQFSKTFSNTCSFSPDRSLFVNTEDEYIPDAESVRLQRERHHQPQTCTLSQCFQLYTKEERVRVGQHLLGGEGSREGPGQDDSGETNYAPENSPRIFAFT